MCKYRKNNSKYHGFRPGIFWLLLCLAVIIVLPQSAGGSVVIGNSTSFTLNDSDGSFRLIKFESIPEATVLQDSSPNGEYMWRITAKNSGGTLYEILPVSGGVLTTEYTNPTETKYNIDWTGLAINTESGVLDVKVSIRVPVDSALTYWDISVTNRSVIYGVWTVEFPKLMELGPLGDADDDVFIDPLVLGHATTDPSQNLTPRNIHYPGYASFQMCAFYDEAMAGAYLATYDGSGYYKHFNYDVDAGSDIVKMWITNFPEGQGVVTTNYQMPYEAVISTFTGDWHDAAAIYREWAVNQIWCQNGKIEVRSDIPGWYKELPMWEAITSGQSGWMETYANTKIGLGFANHWNYMWRDDTGMGSDYTPDIFPPRDYPGADPNVDTFDEVVAQAHGADVSLIPYFLGGMMDNRSSQYTDWGASSHVVKDENGSTVMGGANLEWMCPYEDWWPDHVADISETIMNYGVDGVYYDTISGNCHQCFDPSHGHPVGGGNYWFTGNRKLFERSRVKIRAVDTNGIMTSENPCEAYIDVVDGFLQFTGMDTNYAPIFQMIYHDYINLYGNSLAHGKIPNAVGETLKDYPMCLPLGLSFIQGDQLGWIAIWNILIGIADPPPPDYVPYDDFSSELAMWRKMAHFRQKAAKKYLALGQMVKPPVLQGTDPNNVSGNWWNGDVIAPGVLHSAWKASDGKLGIIMLNITPASQTVTYQFDSNDYWGTTDEVDSYVLDLNADEEATRTFYKAFADGSVQIEKTLQPLEFWALEFGCPAVPRREDQPGRVVIENGRGSSASGEWSLELGSGASVVYAVSVQMDGVGGDVRSHDWGDPPPSYAGEEGYTTFWHEGATDKSWVYPVFKRTDFLDDFGQDLSAYMNGSANLRIRTIDWVLANNNFARTVNIQFIFDGTVGGASKRAVFTLYVDPYCDTRGWIDGVWHDVEVNLDNGFFTIAGSTAPSGTQSSLYSVQHTFTAGEALEFWQNVTAARLYFQTQGMIDVGGGQYDTWMDIQYFELNAADPTNCAETLAQGYTIDYDLNDDCKVDLEDFSIIADEWFDCIVPGEAGCDQPWLP